MAIPIFCYLLRDKRNLGVDAIFRMKIVIGEFVVYDN